MLVAGMLVAGMLVADMLVADMLVGGMLVAGMLVGMEESPTVTEAITTTTTRATMIGIPENIVVITITGTTRPATTIFIAPATTTIIEVDTDITATRPWCRFQRTRSRSLTNDSG